MGGGGFGHPTCLLLPPLISLGERMEASGKDILSAYVVGFKAGKAMPPGAAMSSMSEVSTKPRYSASGQQLQLVPTS